jgi:small GTP-binding protein
LWRQSFPIDLSTFQEQPACGHKKLPDPRMPPSDVKVVFLGSSNVGKTSIIVRASTHEFDRAIPSTIAVGFTNLSIETPSGAVSFQIWDTAGQERFRTLAPMYYRGADVAILVFALDDAHSLTDIELWVEEMKSQVNHMPRLYVVANKMDLTLTRKVETAEGETVAKRIGAEYCEVSAKLGSGIDELFWRIAEDVRKTGTERREHPQIHLKKHSKKTKKKGLC